MMARPDGFSLGLDRARVTRIDPLGELAVGERKLFISHSSEDKAFVNRLIARMNELGLKRPWYDVYELGPTSSDISAAIRVGVGNAGLFCLVLSPKSSKSQWVSFEIQQALQEDTAVAVILNDAPTGVGPFLVDNPHVNELLRGGQRKVIDFGDFEEGFAHLLIAVDSDLGEAYGAERRLYTILEHQDPDVAEEAMGFAALEPDVYLAALLVRLPDLSDDPKLHYRVSRALAYMPRASVGPLFDFLVATQRPEASSLPPPVQPDDDDSGGVGVYSGTGPADMLRWMIATGGNRRWFAQRGAMHCLTEIARRDETMSRVILEGLERYLKKALNEIPSVRDGEIPDEKWDALRTVIDTVAAIGPTGVVDQFVIEQFVSAQLWGSLAVDAAYKLCPSVCRCLAAYGSAEARDRLLGLARGAENVRAVWFEHKTGRIRPNPWDDCFVRFGKRAVDPLLAALSTHGEQFAPFAFRNLAWIPHPRSAKAALEHAVARGGDESEATDLLAGIGFAGSPEGADALLRTFLEGSLDEFLGPEGSSSSYLEEALAAAIGSSSDRGLAVAGGERLITADSPAVLGRLAGSFAEAHIIRFVDNLEQWRLEAAHPYPRGRSAIALAQLQVFKDARPLHEQLQTAEDDLEAPLVGVALSHIGDDLGLDALVRGLRGSFEVGNDFLHELTAEALDRLGTPAAMEERQKWYRRI